MIDAAQYEAGVACRRVVSEEDDGFALEVMVATRDQYLDYCLHERRLSAKTVKAYAYDLDQFLEWARSTGARPGRPALKAYLAHLNTSYAASSVKRKLASVRAWTYWLSNERYIYKSPFDHWGVSLRQPLLLPRVIGTADLRRIVEPHGASTTYKRCMRELRDQAVIELLVATGARVSEISALNIENLNLTDQSVRIFGKGSKERMVYLGSSKTLEVLERYLAVRMTLNQYVEEEHAKGPQPALRGMRGEKGTKREREPTALGGERGVGAEDMTISGRLQAPDSGRCALFLNSERKRLSDQGIRKIVAKRAQSVGVKLHVTPHMFRHTFATILLEQDVDIRYIQKLLGHSSVKTTERYTYVASAKLRKIMTQSNPRDVISAGEAADEGEPLMKRI